MRRIPIRPWMRREGLRAVFAAFGDIAGGDCIRFVGGCVRDSIRGDAVGDVDLAVRCPPDELVEILRSRFGSGVHPVGLDHGVVVVAVGEERYELASLRKDVVTDGRHALIAYTDDWSQDARRRDFRCNAVYADFEGRLFDPTGGGIDDIERGRVIFAGDPATRIREDYLRILRFFRFSARYASRIDSAGLAACAGLRDGLARISAERIWSEVKALLVAPGADHVIEAMQDSLVLEQILPGCGAVEVFAVVVGADRRMGFAPDAIMRLVALMSQDTDVSVLAERLRMSSQERKALVADTGSLESGPIDTAMLSRLIYRIGADATAARLRLHWARGADMHPDVALIEHIGAWQVPHFPLKGCDAIEAGLSGADIGMVLRRIEDEWVSLDFLPTRDQLMRRLSVLVQSMRA